MRRPYRDIGVLVDAAADEVDLDARVVGQRDHYIGAVRDNGRMELHRKSAGHRNGACSAIQEYDLAIPNRRCRRLCDSVLSSTEIFLRLGRSASALDAGRAAPWTR